MAELTIQRSGSIGFIEAECGEVTRIPQLIRTPLLNEVSFTEDGDVITVGLKRLLIPGIRKVDDYSPILLIN